MKTRALFICVLFLLCLFNGHAQEKDKWAFEKKHFVGSQVFMILTPLLDPSPEYYQFNFGYRFTSKDELSIEAITWEFQGPIGRPYGPDYDTKATSYPGDVKSFGAGFAYKRMLWKGAYAQVHSMAFHQTYRDLDKKKIQSGFMLFNTFRLGYHFKIFKNKRWFLTPSIACTYWPIYTNLPESFQQEEDKWPNYFLFEPGLQFGFTF